MPHLVDKQTAESGSSFSQDKETPVSSSFVEESQSKEKTQSSLSSQLDSELARLKPWLRVLLPKESERQELANSVQTFDSLPVDRQDAVAGLVHALYQRAQALDQIKNSLSTENKRSTIRQVYEVIYGTKLATEHFAELLRTVVNKTPKRIPESESEADPILPILKNYTGALYQYSHPSSLNRAQRERYLAMVEKPLSEQVIALRESTTPLLNAEGVKTRGIAQTNVAPVNNCYNEFTQLKEQALLSARIMTSAIQAARSCSEITSNSIKAFSTQMENLNHQKLEFGFASFGRSVKELEDMSKMPAATQSIKEGAVSLRKEYESLASVRETYLRSRGESFGSLNKVNSVKFYAEAQNNLRQRFNAFQIRIEIDLQAQLKIAERNYALAKLLPSTGLTIGAALVPGAQGVTPYSGAVMVGSIAALKTIAFSSDPDSGYQKAGIIGGIGDFGRNSLTLGISAVGGSFSAQVGSQISATSTVAELAQGAGKLALLNSSLGVTRRLANGEGGKSFSPSYVIPDAMSGAMSPVLSRVVPSENLGPIQTTISTGAVKLTSSLLTQAASNKIAGNDLMANFEISAINALVGTLLAKGLTLRTPATEQSQEPAKIQSLPVRP